MQPLPRHPRGFTHSPCHFHASTVVPVHSRAHIRQRCKEQRHSNQSISVQSRCLRTHSDRDSTVLQRFLVPVSCRKPQIMRPGPPHSTRNTRNKHATQKRVISFPLLWSYRHHHFPATMCRDHCNHSRESFGPIALPTRRFPAFPSVSLSSRLALLLCGRGGGGRV